jgi:hypothetical protein
MQPAARAQIPLPEPRLTVVSPAGGRAGESVRVQITGSDTEDASLRFSHPGIHAEPDPKNPKEFTVTIPADSPPALHDVRIIGRFGISNPRRFEVTKLPEVNASPKALSREESQEITPPCVIHGTAAAAQVQWLKITPPAGSEWVFDCHATALDSRMDPLLVLHNHAGREIARSRRHPLRWKAADDTPLFLAVRDFLSNGGPEYGYRLHVVTAADTPAPTRNTPLLLWPLAEKFRTEAEPNPPATAQKIELPAEIRGVFAPARDVDAFVFEAKKDETWWVECVSNRLGLPTHPRVVLERVEKKTDGGETPADATEIPDAPWFAGDPDFDGLHFDPIGKFTPKKDGPHRAVVRDLNNTLEGAEPRSYALSIRKADPDFALICAVLPPVPNKPYAAFNGPTVAVRAANLRRGQTLALRVMAVRRDGFSGTIHLAAEGLPAGVSAEPCVVAPGQSEGILLLHATADAPPWTGAVRVMGRASIAGTERLRTAQPFTPVWESTANSFVDSARNRPAAELALAVVDEPPLPSILRTTEHHIESKTDGKIKIGLRAERSAPAPGALKLKLAGLPGLEKAKLKDAEIPPQAEKTEYEIDLAPLKLSPGTYTLWFRGDEKTKREIRGSPTDVTVSLISNALTLTLH